MNVKGQITQIMIALHESGIRFSSFVHQSASANQWPINFNYYYNFQVYHYIHLLSPFINLLAPNCFLSIEILFENVINTKMNFAKKLPPMPNKSAKRILSPLEQVLNQDHNLFRIIPKPLSKQSVTIIDSENQEIAPKRQRRISIEKVLPRCKSSKNISQERSFSSQKSISKVPKHAISGKLMANLPYITAKNWAIFEINTNQFIYGRKQDIRREVASLTKISNLITILEILSEHSLDPSKILVTVTKQSVSMNGTTAEIKQGMVLTLKDLFYGMMLPSGNDAAYQIAQIGGTIINLSRENLKLEPILYDRESLSIYLQKYNNNVIVHLNKMNTIAKFKAKTVNTSFANPHGLSNVNSLSTAQDMAKLSAYSMRNDKFREVVETKNYFCQYKRFSTHSNGNNQNNDPNSLLPEISNNDAKKLEGELCWENTNKMLWRGFSGIKTGITPNAGPCLSASVKKTIDGKEYEFVVILLKSFSMETRWKEVEGLAEWACEIIKK